MSEDMNCQAVTSDGDSCNNKAAYPEDNPVACHIKSHQKQMDEKLKEVSMTSEEKAKKLLLDELDKVDKVELEPKLHVFASKSLHHIVFIDTGEKPEEKGERDYFRVEFNGGKYETYDDKKAKLLKKQVEKHKALRRKITKVQ